MPDRRDAESIVVTEPASEPGWHPDPHGGPGLRWHDGTAWTDHVHELAPPTPAGTDAADTAAAAAAANALADQLLAQARRASPAASVTSRAAIAAITTGVIGVPLVPTALGIAALRTIGASAGQLAGRGMAIAGIVLGIVNVVVIGLLVTAVVPTIGQSTDPGRAIQLMEDAAIVTEALEQCAAAAGGSYASCSGDAVAAIAPGLASQLQACGAAPPSICIHVDADGRGYTFSSIAASDTPLAYAQQRTADGRILRSCTGGACPEDAPRDAFPIPVSAPAAA